MSRRSQSATLLRSILFGKSYAFLCLIDFLISATGYYIGFKLSPYEDQVDNSEALAFIIFTHCLITVIILVGLNGYYLFRRYKPVVVAINITIANSLAFFISLAIMYISFYTTIGRIFAFYGAIASILFLGSYKALCRIYLAYRPLRFTTIGGSHELNTIQDSCARDGRLFKFIKLDFNINHKEECLNLLYNSKINTVIICDDLYSESTILELVFFLISKKIIVNNDITFYSDLFQRYPVNRINKAFLANKGVSSNYKLKRFFDLTLAIPTLILILPLLLAIAIIIKLTSKGPIFFNQKRMGQYGNEFLMYKFRTMHQSVSKQDASGGFTQKADSRVTLIGKLLRPSHFDELPQLLNIIKGDMSIVGVRPEAMSFAKKMQKEIPLYIIRYWARPGLTGHAQITQGYALDTIDDTKKKLSYDLFYLSHEGMIFDMTIIIKTCFALLKKSR